MPRRRSRDRRKILPARPYAPPAGDRGSIPDWRIRHPHPANAPPPARTARPGSRHSSNSRRRSGSSWRTSGIHPSAYVHLLVWKMDFEWDEAKRQTNLVKHGIDFADTAYIFDGQFVEREDKRDAYGERRYQVTGAVEGQVLRVVYTRRGDRYRIISARRARRNERR